MELDMTKGNPFQLIIRFMLPVFFGNLFQQLYNTVDTIIVGRFVGTGALAAVGATGTISFLILGFVSGLTTGFTVLTAQRFGAGDIKGMKRSIGNATILSVIVAVVMTLLSVIYMKPLLTWMNTPKDIYVQAYAYIIVICGGMITNIIYNMSASVLRAVGNSKAPLYFLVIAVVINCVLDLVFIINFKMGVAGAAWATVVSQGISGVLCLVYMWKKIPLVHPEKEDWKLNGPDSKVQLRIGIPMALQFSITAVGTILVQTSLNLFGSIAVAGYTAACKVEQLAGQMFFAIGTTMATYSAQNKGVGDIKRIKKGARTAALINIVYAIVVGILCIVTIKYAISLFVSGDDILQVTEYATIYIKVVAPFFIPLGAIFIYRNVLQGAGYALAPMMGGVMELIARVVVAYIAAKYMSFTGVCAANIAAWVAAAVYLWIVYLVVMKRAQESQNKIAEI